MKNIKERAYLSVGDIRGILGIGYSTAYRLMQMLPHVDIAPPGSRYKTMRLEKKELERYLRQREVRA
jgi:hypothetical protein